MAEDNKKPPRSGFVSRLIPNLPKANSASGPVSPPEFGARGVGFGESVPAESPVPSKPTAIPTSASKVPIRAPLDTGPISQTEWEKAQEGWNALKRAAGAIPPGAATSAPDVARDIEQVRSGKILPKSGSGEKPEKPMSEVHADDKAIIIAIGGGAFCAGLFGFYEGQPFLGTAFTVGGLVTMAPISPFVRSNIKWAFGRPALWTLATVTWLFLATNLGLFLYGRLAATPPPVVATGNVWESLTSDQKKVLSLAIKLLPSQQHFRVICLTSDCKDLAESFMAAFHEAGWNPLFASSTAFFQEPYGIVLYLKDPNNKALEEAIEKTTNIKIDHVEAATDPTGVESLFIGFRP